MRILIASGLAVRFGAGVLALAPPSQATGCASGSGGGYGGGGFCDGDIAPDGSYMHCESVYVLGFGGASCNRIYPPPPPPA